VTSDNGADGADRIEIRGLRVVATHGALPEEQVRPQPFEFNLDLWIDTKVSAQSDRLEDTVDYGAVLDRTEAVATQNHYVLLEALADAVAASLLALDSRLAAVAVTARKLRPPVAHDVTSAGVRVFRRRPPSGG
jgi:7,8-dihydroneopterin aldolase/epimerase/oxygenase